MEIIPLVGDMRYKSFLDKSKEDIASSSELVLGRSLFISSKPLLGFHKLGISANPGESPREMQDNTVPVEEEKPSSSAKKLLNHWLRFNSASSDPTFCNRNTWRAMRVILSYLFTFREFTLDVKINSISIIGGADGTSPSKMRALANVDPIDVARNIAELNPETTLDKH
ncbi:unnamed protein product [Prunus brigantina]